MSKMKKIILQVVLPVFMCAVFSSCININSLNRVDPALSLNCTQDQYEDDCCGGSVKTELYFGLLKPDGTIVSEEEWQAFVDKSVCPVVEGFTIVDAVGQCKNADGKIVKEATKMLIIVQEDEDDGSIGEIKKEFKKSFPKNAFFRVSYPVASSLDDDDEDADND
jgi:hypothetical protein